MKISKLKKTNNLDKIIENLELEILMDNKNSEDMDESLDQLKLLYSIKTEKEQSEDWQFYVKCGIEIIGVCAPLIFYNGWMHKGLEFEKEGTFTSKTFTGLIGKFRSTK